MNFAPIPELLEEIRNGRMVVVTERGLIVAAY